MTREEAIAILKDLWTYLQTDIRQALEIAIKELEQELSGDAVSRKTIMEHYSTGELSKISYVNRYNLLKFVEQLPSVKPQTGHWIEKMDACECPYCHKAWDYCDNDTEDFDYCPKCGAKLSEIPTGSKDVIWYSKRNYSEIVVEPQERSDKE